MSNPFERPPGQPEKPKIVTCQACGGKGKDSKDEKCKRCNGEGKVRDN